MFHPFKPDRGQVPTLWMIMLFVSILALFGVMSGSVEVGTDFSKTRKPYDFDTPQIAWAGVQLAAWAASMVLSWQYKRDFATRVGAGVLASLPLALASFYLAFRL